MNCFEEAQGTSSEAVDAFSREIRKVNTIAHYSDSLAVRHAHFLEKDVLLSKAITIFDLTRMSLSYQLQPNGQPMIVVTLRGRKASTFHQPFDRLSEAARCRVLNTIGTPYAFERRCRSGSDTWPKLKG